MKNNEKPVPLPHPGSPLRTHPTSGKTVPLRPDLQQQPAPDDNEDDPISTEGYLPEIYFSLKSENPADW